MPPTAQHNVLILVTDSVITNQLQLIVNALGMRMISASDSHDFMGRLQETHPEFVILDVGASEFDGFQLLESIRSSGTDWIRNIPIMIGSNTGDLVEISRALHLGIRDYFVKSSFDSQQVLEKLKKHVQSAAPQVAGTANPDAHAIKVLMIEDDKFLRDLAAQKLTKEKLDVTTAVDGEQGIALAEKIMPNVILLDILLPGIDGYEVLRRVRANPLLDHTHVAMLSNFGQREDIQKALEGGADNFLVKANYTLDEVVAEVKKIIEKPRVVTPRT